MVTTTRVSGLFRHPDLQHVRAALSRSPIARSWIERLDEIPVKVSISEVPAKLDARGVARVEDAAWNAFYHPIVDRVGLSRLAVATEPIVRNGRALEAPPLEIVANMALHEGIHNARRGSMANYVLDLTVRAPVRMVREGVRELRSPGAPGRGAMARLWDGVKLGVMREEVFAYREAGRATAQLGWTGPFVKDGVVASELAIADDLLRDWPYRLQFGASVAVPVLAGVTLVSTGRDVAGIVAHRADREQ